MGEFLQKLWLGFGELLAGKYLRHHPKAFFATSTRDLKGEFGIVVAIFLVAIPFMTKMYFEVQPGIFSGAMWVCALAFVILAKCRRGFFRRILSSNQLFYLGAKRG